MYNLVQSVLFITILINISASTQKPRSSNSDKINGTGNRNNTNPPNFIVMLMDDMGWGDLGCNGEPNKETPHIDNMARYGLTMQNMYAASPLCSPSRAALLTGRLPIRNGFYSDNAPGRNAYTPQEIVGGISDYEILLPEMLKKKEYTNAIIGKWHLGHQEKYMPLKRGFDKFFGSTNCHFGPYDNISTPNIPVFSNSKMIGRYFEQFAINKRTGESNITRLFTEEAVNFIYSQRNQHTPFFLLWAPDSTHAPTYASNKYSKSSRRAHYGTAVREIDDGVGAILKALTETSQSSNTLVFFTSDNGPALVSKLEGGSNGPFLCGKQTTFEGGMRTPGIFYWPGTILKGKNSYQLSTHMDIFTTFLSLAGIPKPDDRKMDGIVLTDIFKNKGKVRRRPVFFYRGDRLMAVRRGSYKIHLWTWNTSGRELRNGIDYCPGQRMFNITTKIPTDHRKNPVMFNVDADQGEKYPIPHWNNEYSRNVGPLMDIVYNHMKYLVKGKPQLNWCDQSVMHWSPPGCQELGDCIPPPPSKPYKCEWNH